MRKRAIDTAKIHDLLKQGLSRKEIIKEYGFSRNAITRSETEFGKILPEIEIRRRWKIIIPDIKRRFREEILAMDNNL